MLLTTSRFSTILFNLRRSYSSLSLEFVPKHEPILENDFELLRDFIKDHNRILIVTGAGISTESGIPDYRSEEVGLYARTNHKPIQYQQFLSSPKTRQRYWARNFIGWPRFSQRQPNNTHYAIKQLEVNNKLTTTVTQNVDHLHFKAGSKDIIELHGTSYIVMCLGCPSRLRREEFQKVLQDLNPEICDKDLQTKMIRPDGDVEIPQELIESFKIPPCKNCGGIYKPDIIFFGDNVPRTRVELIKNKVEESDSILVLGSSLSVFSSYRIILQGAELNLPIAMVNIGPTRADNLIQLKLAGKCGEILPRLCQSLFNK